MFMPIPALGREAEENAKFDDSWKLPSYPKPITGSPRLAVGEESQALLFTAICNEQSTLIGISQAYS
jgi:hypothetical protein